MTELFDLLDDGFENIPELAEDVTSPLEFANLDTKLIIKSDQLRESFLRGQAKGIKHSETNSLSHLFAVNRKKSNLTVESLSDKTGVALDNIIDLECRQLRLSEAKKVGKELIKTLEIDQKDYDKALQTDKYNLKLKNR